MPPFEHQLPFDPAEPLDAWLLRVPAKWVVYLMSDVDDRPVQLLCVKNLRYSLKRRLGGDDVVGPSKRVVYKDLIRFVRWTRVDSTFEADLLYHDIARQIFPESYQGMLGFRPAWFLHVNPDTAFPRFIKTTDLQIGTGTLVGPVEDKHAANRLIEEIEDWFDLCRYYNILVQSPRGLPCAYKEMGKCPAPCDGSISMDQYRMVIELSLKVLLDPADYIREQQRRMSQAAAELRFEIAAKIKTYIDSLSQLGKGPFRFLNSLAHFQFLSLQRGPGNGKVKVFLITPGHADCMCCLTGEKFKPADVLRLALETAATASTTPDAPGVERIGIVAHHLFGTKSSGGIFLPLATIDEKSIAKAYRDLQKQSVLDEGDDEGIVRELQSMM
jgi:excinuclease UvrABC nuclease subunit